MHKSRLERTQWAGKTRSLEMNALLFFPIQSRRKKRTEQKGTELSGRKCYSSFSILNVLFPCFLVSIACFLCSLAFFFLDCCELSFHASLSVSRSSYCSILMDLSLARRCVWKRNIVTWPILLQQGSSISLESVNK